ncbi:Hypothetical protein FKW44_017320 [Caligus rogercresseyi]|uniref:Uncharacterized protein n=1 Tax=Caligus rogercresseyi TaxID=217165 RepID=A0A7T8JWV7_CALRO|nr:Hypothetical protein FKW44_017320 [Caligus rogercresseyi]
MDIRVLRVGPDPWAPRVHPENEAQAVREVLLEEWECQESRDHPDPLAFQDHQDHREDLEAMEEMENP